MILLAAVVAASLIPPAPPPVDFAGPYSLTLTNGTHCRAAGITVTAEQGRTVLDLTNGKIECSGGSVSLEPIPVPKPKDSER